MKTSARFLVLTLAVSTLSAPAAQATEPEACYEEYDVCMQQASGEPVDWIRDYSEQRCELMLNHCLYSGG